MPCAPPSSLSFINRLDETVIFDPLSPEDLSGIVDLLVESMADRLKDRRISLNVTEGARGWLTRRGYDPAYGARPLRRLIQREIGESTGQTASERRG